MNDEVQPDRSTEPSALSAELRARMLSCPEGDEAAFVAVRDKVQQAVDEGVLGDDVHAHLVEQRLLEVSYPRFIGYCGNFGVHRQRSPRHQRAPGNPVAGDNSVETIAQASVCGGTRTASATPDTEAPQPTSIRLKPATAQADTLNTSLQSIETAGQRCKSHGLDLPEQGAAR